MFHTLLLGQGSVHSFFLPILAFEMLGIECAISKSAFTLNQGWLWLKWPLFTGSCHVWYCLFSYTSCHRVTGSTPITFIPPKRNRNCLVRSDNYTKSFAPLPTIVWPNSFISLPLTKLSNQGRMTVDVMPRDDSTGYNKSISPIGGSSPFKVKSRF